MLLGWLYEVVGYHIVSAEAHMEAIKNICKGHYAERTIISAKFCRWYLKEGGIFGTYVNGKGKFTHREVGNNEMTSKVNIAVSLNLKIGSDLEVEVIMKVRRRKEDVKIRKKTLLAFNINLGLRKLFPKLYVLILC